MIGGVASGLGRYFGVDPILFRIGLVALTFFGGTGFFVYAAMMLFVPVEGSTKPPIGVRFFHGDREVWKRVGLFTAVIAGSTLIAVAGAWAAGTGHGAHVAIAVIVLGVAMVALAFRGGARWLILPALALALPAGVVSASGADLHGGVGERSHRPHTLQDVRDGYELGVGHLEVDLRDVAFPPGDHPLELRIGMGDVDLIVPKDVCVATNAEIGAGYVGALDRDAAGLDVDWSDTPTPPPGVPRLVVEADVGMGALFVSHRPIADDDREFEPGKYGANDACRRQPGESR
jgi:phage shock protein PspC (stress-responsive transcriptional regulator)